MLFRSLQDHNRAVIMGQQPFGKGSVQTILPLGNQTAIKLTTARYYTPNGRSIQAKGITPDIPLEGPADRAASLRIREADLSKHLEDNRKPAPDGAKDGKDTKDGAAKGSKGVAENDSKEVEKEKALSAAIAGQASGEVRQARHFREHQPLGRLGEGTESRGDRKSTRLNSSH